MLTDGHGEDLEYAMPNVTSRGHSAIVRSDGRGTPWDNAFRYGAETCRSLLAAATAHRQLAVSGVSVESFLFTAKQRTGNYHSTLTVPW
jgi:hypothetical protein